MAGFKDKAKPDYTFVVGPDAAPAKAETQTEKPPFWKRPAAAVAIVAVVIVLGTLFGVRRSLTQASAVVTEQFYQGTDGSGYGIATDLDKILEFSGNLVTVANKYGSQFSAQAQAVTQARLALDEAEGAAARYKANEALLQAVEALNQAMQDADLADRDEQYRSELYASILSRTTIIAHEATDYNAQVRSFNQDVLGAFPANLLSGLAGVDQLEEYS